MFNCRVGSHCSKAISVCAKYDGEGWDLISGKVKAKEAIPIVDVLALAATGSEYDCGCVISNTSINDKRGYLGKELNVSEDKIDEMADHILKYDSTYGPHMYVSLNKEALVRILKASM